mmetsp:Transcript_2335/g.5015  ORF Transcript_2335/g.5015 Transcript_2335/m.5015 type:complete len:200 (-) Transcript_2335:226-825(-)
MRMVISSRSKGRLVFSSLVSEMKLTHSPLAASMLWPVATCTPVAADFPNCPSASFSVRAGSSASFALVYKRRQEPPSGARTAEILPSAFPPYPAKPRVGQSVGLRIDKSSIRDKTRSSSFSFAAATSFFFRSLRWNWVRSEANGNDIALELLMSSLLLLTPTASFVGNVGRTAGNANTGELNPDASGSAVAISKSVFKQ